MGIIGRVRETLSTRRKPSTAQAERLAQQPQTDRTIASEHLMIPDGLCALCNAACCRDEIIPIRLEELTKGFFGKCVMSPEINEFLQENPPVILLTEPEILNTIPTVPEYLQLVGELSGPTPGSELIQKYPYLQMYLKNEHTPYLRSGVYLLRDPHDNQLLVGINGPCPWLNGNLCTLHEKYQNPNQPTPYHRGTQRLIECIRVSPGSRTCTLARLRDHN